MKDSYSREINYLRLSLTGRCNLNCIYCKRDPVGRPDISLEEIKNLVEALAELGINKVRLTGGEPLMRDDIVEITKTIASIPGITDLAMTTNAILLTKYAKDLKAAGLHRLNISLNTLDYDTFKNMARFGKLPEVLAGIEAAKEAGFEKIKFNTVLMRGENDKDIETFIEYAKNEPIEVRFIEYMPMGDKYEKAKVIKADEVLAAHPELYPIDNADKKSVATLYTGDGFKGKVGFITPISSSFCDNCNRIRVTHDLKVRMCLGKDFENDLAPFIYLPKEELKAELSRIIKAKPEKGFCSGFTTQRKMGNIGG